MVNAPATYSDWRSISPLSTCPRCGCTHLESRDCPGGLEVACMGICGYREVFSPEQIETWFQDLRLPPGGAR